MNELSCRMMNLDNPAYLYKSLIERKMLLRQMANSLNKLKERREERDKAVMQGLPPVETGLGNLLDFSIENRTRKQGLLERLIRTSQERCDEYRSVHINEIDRRFVTEILTGLGLTRGDEIFSEILQQFPEPPKRGHSLTLEGVEAVGNNAMPVVAIGQGVQNHNIDVEMEEV
ncbi:unnamed protein product [Caenorhabditis auriculariae]|uniref:Uncharacterized protein n=1 Tax=Caenorhabditis auriculariae TaxID=2777116 RepID=A0A8S1H7D2_9PELO|nr:unnamed protein product [Caenorhabditis auriculariae]